MSDLTKAEEKVVAKALYNAGYSAGEIEKFLGISDNTVLRARNTATPEELKQFEVDFQKSIQDMKRTGIGLVQKRLLELIPKERRIDMVVKAGEYLEGKNAPSTLVQNNFFEKASQEADKFMVKDEN